MQIGLRTLHQALQALAVAVAPGSAVGNAQGYALILGEDEQSPVRCLPAGYGAQASARHRRDGDAACGNGSQENVGFTDSHGSSLVPGSLSRRTGLQLSIAVS